MPITEALKKLIKTITGKNAVGETIEELVTNLNDNYPEGGGDAYETVAEIAVGQMQPEGGMYLYVCDGVPFTPQAEDATLYWGEEIALERLSADMYAYNFDGEKAVGEPAYGLQLSDDATSVLAVFSSTDSLSNTTVTILKKVSGGGSVTVDSELSETSEHPVQNKVIAAALAQLADMIDSANPLIIPATASGSFPSITVNITTELADIYAAASAGREVILEVPEDAFGGAGAKLRFRLGEYSLVSGEYDFTFALTLYSSNSGPAHYSVDFENAQSAAIDMAALAVHS